MVIVHTDHGTFNGDHGRIGKLQTHEFAAKNMIPFLIYHPELGHGERRSQLVQNVDIYATVLAAFGREAPPERHGVNLLPALADPAAPTRDYAIAGQFARSATITDGRWTLHQGPDPEQPLYWYGYHQQRFYGGQQLLGPYEGGRRLVERDPVPADYLGTWLSDLQADPSERRNCAAAHPQRVAEMQAALGAAFDRYGAPAELRRRFRLPEPATAG